MSPYVCDCTNVVCMFYVYCIYYYVIKFEARSLFSTSHLTTTTTTTTTGDLRTRLHTETCVRNLIKFRQLFCNSLTNFVWRNVDNKNGFRHEHSS